MKFFKGGKVWKKNKVDVLVYSQISVITPSPGFGMALYDDMTNSEPVPTWTYDIRYAALALN